VNAMTLVKTMVHIFKQGIIKDSSFFETFDQAIKNISNDLASTA